MEMEIEANSIEVINLEEEIVAPTRKKRLVKTSKKTATAAKEDKIEDISMRIERIEEMLYIPSSSGDESSDKEEEEEKKSANEKSITSLLSGFTFQKKPYSRNNSLQNSNDKPPTRENSSLVKSDEKPSNIQTSSLQSSAAKSVTSDDTGMKSEPTSVQKVRIEIPLPKSKLKKVIKKKNDENDLKNRIKEDHLDTVSTYLFNYMKDAKENAINLMSLKRTLIGLVMDGVTEEQATKMINYKGGDSKKKSKKNNCVNFDELKQIVRDCKLRFDSNGKII
jgi:hypothetical protein